MNFADLAYGFYVYGFAVIVVVVPTFLVVMAVLDRLAPAPISSRERQRPAPPEVRFGTIVVDVEFIETWEIRN